MFQKNLILLCMCTLTFSIHKRGLQIRAQLVTYQRYKSSYRGVPLQLHEFPVIKKMLLEQVLFLMSC